ALLGCARELDDLASAEHAHLERGTWRRAGQLVADLLDVLLGRDGDAVDRENDVAPQGHFLAADGDRLSPPSRPMFHAVEPWATVLTRNPAGAGTLKIAARSPVSSIP